MKLRHYLLFWRDTTPIEFNSKLPLGSFPLVPFLHLTVGENCEDIIMGNAHLPELKCSGDIMIVLIKEQNIK